MEEITEEQAKLNQFYENLCTYFSCQIGYGPDAYIDYVDAKMAWDGFRSCIDHITAEAVFPLKEYQQMKIPESAIESMLKNKICHDLAEYLVSNLAGSMFTSKETDSNGHVVVRVKFNFINPERLKEVKPWETM